MLNLINKTIPPPPITITGVTIPPSRTNIYINLGDMLDCKFITDKYNYYRPEKIDLRLINTASNEYVNVGEWVDAKKINRVINDMP
jgi:hypothetical protein